MVSAAQPSSSIAVLLADVDRTVVTKDKVITARAIDAVRQMREKGIIFTVTSGRPPRGLELFFKHTAPAMRAMAQLIHQRRYPAELMPMIAAEDTKNGPYHPCPCGSGQKFRFCHGNNAPQSTFTGVGPETTSRPGSSGGGVPPHSMGR